jgi:predicted nucleic acid-binding protein
MYLIDTNVISEARKRNRANPGVRAFFARILSHKEPAYISVVTVAELRRGVELIRHRGDLSQAEKLEHWLSARNSQIFLPARERLATEMP